MLQISIPGRGDLQLQHLVCDVNGTLALDGALLEGVAPRLARLSSCLQIHLITADTHGRQHEIDALLGLRAERLSPGGEAEQKAQFVRRLGAGSCIALGQGANDALMLHEAALGICVLSPEGLAVSALLEADLVANDVLAALDLLEHPDRIKATLRK